MSEGQHWFLVVVVVEKSVAELWDSHPTHASFQHRYGLAKFALRTLDAVLGHLHTGRYEDFRVVVPEFVPRQENNFDSGIYVIKNMQKYGEDWYKEYDSHRQRMFLSIQFVLNFRNPSWQEIVAKLQKMRMMRDKRIQKGTVQYHKN